MGSRRKRTIRYTLAGAAILVAGIVFLFIALQSKDVDMPNDNATPAQVVDAYVAAMDAHDCDTAIALRTKESRDRAADWCRKVSSMTDAQVLEHYSELPEYTGHEALDEVVGVPVTFDLGWRMFHNDGSMDEGHTNWSYSLVRSSPTSAWRIFGEGNG